MNKYYINYDEYSEDDFYDNLESDCRKVAEDGYDDMLDDAYGEVDIVGTSYSSSYLLYTIDRIAYNMGLDDYADSLLSDANYELDHYGSVEIGNNKYEIEDVEEDEEEEEE